MSEQLDTRSDAQRPVSLGKHRGEAQRQAVGLEGRRGRAYRPHGGTAEDACFRRRPERWTFCATEALDGKDGFGLVWMESKLNKAKDARQR